MRLRAIEIEGELAQCCVRESSGPHDTPPARPDALKLESFRGRLGRGCWNREVAPDKARRGCCRGGFLLYCPCSFLSCQVKGPRQRAANCSASGVIGRISHFALRTKLHHRAAAVDAKASGGNPGGRCASGPPATHARGLVRLQSRRNWACNRSTSETLCRITPTSRLPSAPRLE